MRPVRIASLFTLFALLALTTGAGPAAAERPPCGLHPGACFIPIQEGEAFFLYDELSDDDGDGDVDYILYFADGFSDFWAQLPNGKLFAHANEQNSEIIYCPFYPFDDQWNFVAPDESCVYGEGNISVNGFFDELWFICPAEIHVHGAGWRASDGAPFKFSGKYVTVKTGGGEGCGPGAMIQFEIEDDVP